MGNKIFGRFTPFVPNLLERDGWTRMETYENSPKKRVFVLVGIDAQRAMLSTGKTVSFEELYSIMEKSIDVTFVIGTVREFVFIGQGIYERKLRNRVMVLEETTVVKREEAFDDAERNLAELSKEWEICRKVYDAEENVTLYNYLRRNHHPAAKRKFPRKSSRDAYFFFAQRGAHAENFLFRDTRERRKIVVLDVNSMYPFCITKDNYPNPGALKYVAFPDPEEWGTGLFHVRMRRKRTMDAFPERYSYLRYAEDNARFYADVPEDTGIITLLHKNEVEFFSKYYDIECLEGIVSEKAVEHPLKETMYELYGKRTNSEGYEKKLYKSLMVMASSLYMKNAFTRLRDKKEWAEVMRREFGVRNLSNFYRGLYFSDNRVPDLDDPKNVYLLGSQMYANNNVLLAEILEKIYFSGLDAEICYVNVDSVHVSVSEKDYNAFMALVSPMVGKELGKLKVEAVADYAFWFDVGKYVLFDSDGETVKEAGMKRFLSYTVKNGTFKKVRYDPRKALSFINAMNGDPGSRYVPARRVSLSEAQKGINLSYELKEREFHKRIRLYKEYAWTRKRIGRNSR